MTSANPKKMKVSELRAALESRGLSSNGLKTELIQRLELALDEEEFGSEAQEMEELEVPSLNQTKKAELKKKDASTEDATMAVADLDALTKVKTSISFSVNDPTLPEAKQSPGPADKEEDGTEKDLTVGDQLSEKRNDHTKPDADATVKTMTEEEKRAARAAKFGIPLSLEDKKVEDAEENAKRIKRAERFQIETNDTLEKKKQARAERFGLNAEEKRRLERAKRFNLETSESFQVKRQKRLERFATVSN
ncbi:hypothetical protein PsorP6_005793 [Peronosclerospora sorghi]|uniref:Uncharacterized protein n=1 Tax=Peronosclerospora sorghi TaxID=230839 RepID=A0ACC0W5X2_9STRA|nr:hypothetical protein PsorP6_005793 [Peronosclerospora sorghi]